MIKPPCKDKDGTDCQNRAVGCQAKCERYLAFREEKAKERAFDHEKSMNAVYAADNVYHHRKSFKNPTANQRRLIGQR